MTPPANDDVAPSKDRSVSEADLSLYVDGALEGERRAQVEGFLACNPDLAAKVMNALHSRNAGRRGGRRNLGPAARLVLVLTLAGAALSWWAVDRFGLLWEPGYVEEAVMSHRVSDLRAAMLSQAETPHVDATEISRETKLRILPLPAGWKVLDAQVFPSDDGPSLFLLLDTATGRRLGLFAVRADTIVRATPIVAKAGGDYVAYWESGGCAYVLTGGKSRFEVSSKARQLTTTARL